uniref:Uncharacterized protein n=1 Tax=Siphoviridae sp. ctxMM9 TaxID=2827973 RepID=A0A8S5T6M8_9CAUD|nr:MAG TPA: hypothetical protein [Siphoviridae sp. ctxMM9]
MVILKCCRKLHWDFLRVQLLQMRILRMKFYTCMR